MTTDDIDEKAQEQYSSHTEHGGRITTKYVSSSDGYRNGPYAYEVYYTAEGQQWRYLGPVGGVDATEAAGNSTEEFTTSSGETLREAFDPPVRDVEEVLESFSERYANGNEESLKDELSEIKNMNEVEKIVVDDINNSIIIQFEPRVDWKDSGDSIVLETGVHTFRGDMPDKIFSMKDGADLDQTQANFVDSPMDEDIEDEGLEIEAADSLSDYVRGRYEMQEYIWNNVSNVAKYKDEVSGTAIRAYSWVGDSDNFKKEVESTVSTSE